MHLLYARLCAKAADTVMEKTSFLPSRRSQSRGKRTRKEITVILLDKGRDGNEHRVLKIQIKGPCSGFGELRAGFPERRPMRHVFKGKKKCVR